MKYPTVFSFFCAIFLLSASASPLAANTVANDLLLNDPTENVGDASVTANNFCHLLFTQLKADGLISAATEQVKIEYEFHDIFVNEQILSYELMAKYQQIFQENGIKPGPQRQIHLNKQGPLLIGDFGQYGELMEEIRLNPNAEI